MPALDRPRLLRATWLAGLWFALLLAPGAAHADVFSPGDLSNAHSSLEGLKNCTSCHVTGGKLSQEKCLSCHTELQRRIQAGEGYHGKLPAAQRDCESCHHEHQGRAFDLIEWVPSKKGFPHERTGFTLKGKHAQLDCATCHQAKRVQAPDVRALLEKHPKRQTYLGLSTGCPACHFDEHRGQLGQDCKSCHTEQSWKPAPGFDHAKTEYPLEGKHRAVACQKCHASQDDRKTPRDAFPPPVSPSFLAFAGVQHSSCADCHQDPHDNRFGQGCASCHTPDDWHKVRNAQQDRAFHEKTRYPLRGLHLNVPCQGCHGPSPGHPAKFRGLAFQTCASCHPDAHLGQLGRSGKGAPDCAACHSVEGFTPPHFEVQDHQQRTRFPLEGAHRAVACAACHPQELSLASRLPPAVQRELKRGKHLRFNFTLFDIPGNLSRCETCHRDPHAGQFAEKMAGQGCTACHQLTSFADVRFDHARDSRFPLTGKHASVPCASCHVAKAEGKGPPVVRYRPLDTACGACHADVHAGQFAGPGGRPADCASCHTTDDFKKLHFVHAPPFTGFLLEGKHAGARCESCHPLVEVAPGVQTRRYRPLPTTCEGCHVDFHQGAFRGFTP